jgi:putative ABC transport system permease protein
MFVPLETVKERYGEVLMRQRQGSFRGRTRPASRGDRKGGFLEDVMGVADAIKTVMERNHKKKDYQIDVPLEMLKQAEHRNDFQHRARVPLPRFRCSSAASAS